MKVNILCVFQTLSSCHIHMTGSCEPLQTKTCLGAKLPYDYTTTIFAKDSNSNQTYVMVWNNNTNHWILLMKSLHYGNYQEKIITEINVFGIMGRSAPVKLIIFQNRYNMFWYVHVLSILRKSFLNGLL